MDLQRTEEAHRDTPATQEGGSEDPLETYSHSKDSPKNDSSLEQHEPHAHKQKGRTKLNTPCRPPKLAYNHGPSRSSSSPALMSSGVSPSPDSLGIPRCLHLGFKEHRQLLSASRQPPVTKKTLSELDLPCIMSNINLRMDANFDRDLHFKPDLDGEKGQLKRKLAADYWDAMAAEISIYSYNAHNSTEELSHAEQRRTFLPRLPTMFETLQDVLKTLVPERDHPSIMQNLDISLMMQQTRKGVLDMNALANWLATLLKTHCAPMRDEWADRMVEQIGSGSQSQNPREIVNGLQTLFAILEAMKLDVANHQIRAFRVLLVEDTIPFLQEYFRNKTESDNFQVDMSRAWYLHLRDQGLRNADNKPVDNFWPVSVLFQGLCGLLLQFKNPDTFPETLIFDSDRLWKLRSSLQNLINLEISWYIFESYIHSHNRYLSEPANIYAAFRSRIWSLMDEETDEIDPIAAATATRSSPGWVKNLRSIALEIARFAGAACNGEDEVVSDEVMEPIESALEWHLFNESDLFGYIQTGVRDSLLKMTLDLARRYLSMSPLAICEAQRGSPSPTLSPSGVSQDDMERIAMRLAHIGVLHWRVWAPIVYLSEDWQEDAGMMDTPFPA